MSSLGNRFDEKNATAGNVPPRSHLYCFAPQAIGTPLVESLTSYVYRLAEAYRVSPHALVSLEIVPNLSGSHYIRSSPQQLSKFFQKEAMSMNGIGEVAVDWSATLERLTMRLDIRNLNIRLWANGLPPWGLLRATPAWCPVCYQEWRENGLPIYQPLLWMLQIITICPRHMRQLEMNCPYCRVLQPVIPLKSRLGYCKHCSAWLGTSAGTVTAREIGEEKLIWQEWVMNSIEELRTAAASSESLPWERFLVGLATCVEAVGGIRKLSPLTSLSPYVLYGYRNGKHIPSFKSVLELCYPLGISPLQLITSDLETLKRTIQSRKARRSPQSLRSATRRLNRELALEAIQAVLDGREAPRAVRQIEQSLGVGSKTLAHRFPQECALVSAQYRTYRAEKASQRLTRECEEVRQATLTLHAQRIYPSQIRVGALLSDPNRMLIPAVRAAWHAALRELDLE